MKTFFSPMMLRLFGYVHPYRWHVVLTLFTMIGTALTELAFPRVFGYLLDHGFKADANTLALWKIPVAIIGIFLVRGVCTYTTSYLMSWVAGKMQNALRAQVFDQVLRASSGQVQAESSARLINTIMFEVQQIIEMIKVSVTTLFRDSLTVAALLGYLLWLNWRLTLVTLALMPPMAALVRGVSKRLRRLNQSQLEVNAELTQVIEEATRAHQVIKIFAGQAYEAARFHEKNEKLRGYALKTTVAVASTTPVTQLLASCAVAIVIMLAVAQAQEGATTVGGFVTFITAMLLLLTPLKRLADLNGPMQRGMAAAESVFAVIDTQPEPTTGHVLSGRAQGHLQLHGVTLIYPGKEHPALNGVELDIQPGETVALVGTSGGGKTSLVNLVPRFYAPQAGQILLDGLPLESIALDSLRAQIAMVSQNVVLFDDTIIANVAYGQTVPDMQRVEDALRAAHLDDVVRALPQGIYTLIGDNGMRLSGGQRQRLAIARALYKDAPILILDEATSALDSESERMVQAALDRLMQGRTTLVIAHRLSTIERASRIVVMEGGRVVESGTHTALLAGNGVYANLYRLQFSTQPA